MARDEVNRKIGRNILLFQRLENNLKLLVTHGRLSGFASQLQSTQLKHAEAVGKQTLGMVIGQFFEQQFSTPIGDEELLKPLKEPYFEYTIKYFSETKTAEIKMEKLAILVANRNELVHHFLNRIKQDSLDSLLEAGDYLDRQHQEVISELNYFRKLVVLLGDSKKAYSDLLNSEEGKDLLLRGKRSVIEVEIKK